VTASLVDRARGKAGAARERLRGWRLARRLAGPRLIRAFADANPSAFFVEIGSNDGEQHDHLRPFILGRDWNGIMVEPVPYVFERLRANYGHVDRVALENVAIGPRDGTLPFYHLVDATEDERRDLPDWYDGIGSFSRDAVLSHRRDIPDVDRRIVAADVQVVTFESLCDRHGADRVDLLLIDTEGYDWEIIRAIDLTARPPQLLVYEHYHLTPDDRAACAEHVRAAGYRTLEEGFDTFCVRDGVDERLARAFDRLRPAVPGVSKHDEER
jgi:FkbM family methyltransferase